MRDEFFRAGRACPGMRGAVGDGRADGERGAGKANFARQVRQNGLREELREARLERGQAERGRVGAVVENANGEGLVAARRVEGLRERGIGAADEIQKERVRFASVKARGGCGRGEWNDGGEKH